MMIRDCENGLIDMVITKSISRWARNTIDSLQNIRRLKDLGIAVFFEKENINTMEASGELLITIMSSIAQQESDSISKNVRMGIQYMMQQGKGRLNTSQFLGFEKGEEDHSLRIVPSEAVTVRRVFREYLDGYSPAMICKHLTEDGVPTPTGKRKWYQSTVASMLQNEKYCGDLLMQKFYVTDYLSHRIEKNTGQLPQYLVKDHHEPIIPKEVFCLTQDELFRRSRLKYVPGALRFGSEDALTGRLVCGHCGRTLKRYKDPDPERVDWRCRKRTHDKHIRERRNPGKCPCRNVPEIEVKKVITDAFNRIPEMRDELIGMQEVVRKEIAEIITEQNEPEEKDRTLCAVQGDQNRRYPDPYPEYHADTASPGAGNGDILARKAEAENRYLRLRMMLELADIMEERRNGIMLTEEDDGAACYTADDFFRRTRYDPKPEAMKGDGRILFENSLIIRYLDSVIIGDDFYTVRFKCGKSVTETLSEAVERSDSGNSHE